MKLELKSKWGNGIFPMEEWEDFREEVESAFCDFLLNLFEAHQVDMEKDFEMEEFFLMLELNEDELFEEGNLDWDFNSAVWFNDEMYEAMKDLPDDVNGMLKSSGILTIIHP
ncbi:MAG: hypothetical protein FWF59_04110 [Turicibacter sp.]|nr:hypothetical protein [Turicibacter sp.]